MTKNTGRRCGVNPTSQPASPKYCIFGAGAIGGTIAAQLARANATVSVIARAIPASRAIGCVVYMSCAVEAPGVIRHGAGGRLIVGEPENRSSRRPSQRVARLAKWLRRSGFDCVESTDIRRDIWFKLWGNLSMNPISFLTAATLDRIIADPLAHKLCFRMMEEAGRIGEAIGIPATVSIEEMFDRARVLGAAKTSMLQDAEHGKPVEIDALLTVTRDLGRMVGVPTPFIDSVFGLARLKATSLGLLDRAA